MAIKINKLMFLLESIFIYFFNNNYLCGKLNLMLGSVRRVWEQAY